MERICSESLKFANLIVLIDPLPPGPGLIRKTGDFSHKLEEYRLALRRTSEKFGSSRVEVVAIGDICVAESMNFEELLLDDGHHLSVNGHLRLASALKSFVSTWQDFYLFNLFNGWRHSLGLTANQAVREIVTT